MKISKDKLLLFAEEYNYKIFVEPKRKYIITPIILMIFLAIPALFLRLYAYSIVTLAVAAAWGYFSATQKTPRCIELVNNMALLYALGVWMPFGIALLLSTQDGFSVAVVITTAIALGLSLLFGGLFVLILISKYPMREKTTAPRSSVIVPLIGVGTSVVIMLILPILSKTIGTYGTAWFVISGMIGIMFYTVPYLCVELVQFIVLKMAKNDSGSAP